MTDKTTPVVEQPAKADALREVEQVARLIEPGAWFWFDLSAKCYEENRGSQGQENFFYEATYRAGCRTVEEYRQWWKTAEPPHVNLHMALWRESFVKARTILAALSPTPEQPAKADEVERVEIDRPFMLAAARAWWAVHMGGNVRAINITGDGRVKVAWSDADESGHYTLPVDFLAALSPASATSERQSPTAERANG